MGKRNLRLDLIHYNYLKIRSRFQEISESYWQTKQTKSTIAYLTQLFGLVELNFYFFWSKL